MSAPSLAPPLRVLLADREGGARRALTRLLSDLDGVELVDTVGDRDQLASALRRTRPDVLVVDDRLLGDGLGAHDDGLRILVLGVDDDPAFAQRAQRLGAEAWIAKDRADERLSALLAG